MTAWIRTSLLAGDYIIFIWYFIHDGDNEWRSYVNIIADSVETINQRGFYRRGTPCWLFSKQTSPFQRIDSWLNIWQSTQRTLVNERVLYKKQRSSLCIHTGTYIQPHVCLKHTIYDNVILTSLREGCAAFLVVDMMWLLPILSEHGLWLDGKRFCLFDTRFVDDFWYGLTYNVVSCNIDRINVELTVFHLLQNIILL